MKLKRSVMLGVAFAAASTVHAQTDGVQVSGVVDGYVGVFDTGSKTVTHAGSSGRRASKIVIRASEDLGNGLRASVNLEAGFKLDTGMNSGGPGSLFGSASTLALSGRWGGLTVGNAYVPYWWALAPIDPTDVSLGSAINYFGPAFDDGRLSNVHNTLTYRSPSINGWMAAVSMSLHEESAAAGPPMLAPIKAGDLYNALLSYRSGSLVLNFSYAQQDRERWVPVGSSASKENTNRFYLVSAQYDFGWVRPSLIYVKRTATAEDLVQATNSGQFGPQAASAVQVEALQLGATVPAFGGSWVGTAGVLRNASFDEAGAFAWGLRYEYPLSRRAVLYGGVTGINNEKNADYRLSPAAPMFGFATPLGANSQGLYLGMTQTF